MNPIEREQGIQRTIKLMIDERNQYQARFYEIMKEYCAFKKEERVPTLLTTKHKQELFELRIRQMTEYILDCQKTINEYIKRMSPTLTSSKNNFP